MIVPNDVSAELSHRIQADLDHFDGTLPENFAISWRGYLAAMLEWNLISPEQYDALLAPIPPVHNDPAITILRGRD
jgi:hypothetical protein